MHVDLLLRGAAIYTMDPTRPRARALAIGDGLIMGVGEDVDSLDELKGRRTRVLDLGGRAVVPGFVDAHVHFGSFALARQHVDLDPSATLEAGLAVVRRATERLPDGAWLRGRGWDRNRWGRLPTAADLDAVVGDRLAALASRDGHSLWLSSAALRAVGISTTLRPPRGGVIECDERGEPTGVVSETATERVYARMPRPSAHEIRDAIRQALPLAAAAGLTGIHNLEDHHSREAFELLEGALELTLRVYHGVARSELDTARERGLWTGNGTELLRVGPVKLFADGALGSRTAHVLEPYTGRDDGYRGVPTLEPAELAAAMRLAADAELDLAVHAIGDAAVRSVLDTYEQTRSAYPPLARRMLRIEHAQLIHPDDVPRMASLGVIASMQPIHATSDWRTAETHWGRRSRHAYAWRDLLRAGVQLAFGTDAPVESIEPLPSLYAAVTRMDSTGEPAGGWYPMQRLSLEQAVRAYTSGSAAAERASLRRGSLAEGKDADLVVLGADPFEREPAALRETRVELTMVGGKITFEGG